MLKKSLLILLLASVSLLAQTHSLVIGINNGNLIGAKNDALYMAQLLRQKGISINYELHNEQATSSNIMSAFKEIVNHAKPNDWVYLFFSGHGTSPYDPANRNKPKLKKRLEGTGALLTADNKLIIVKESLAPLFHILDQRGVHTVVIFDACFSGMAYKDGLNTHANYALFTPTPTRKVGFPYQHLVFLSSTTYSDYASESSRDRRGYFSKAITHCLANNHTRQGIDACLYKVKHTYKELPQKPILLPKSNFFVFPSFSKGITVRAEYPTLKEQLFNLAKPSSDFDLYTQNSHNLPSKNYTTHEKLSVHLNSKLSGYFVLFMMGESQTLNLVFPDNKPLRYIQTNTAKKLFSIQAKDPFGEESMGGFLVNKSAILQLQKLYNKTKGELQKKADIQEAIKIIEQHQIAGSKLSLISSED
jgi:hypothetical protein